MATLRRERSVWLQLFNALLLTYHSTWSFSQWLLCLAEYVKEAVAEDRAENYEKAFELYMTALEFFKTHLKYEKNPKSKEAITAKVRCTIVCQVCVIHSNHHS